MSTALHVALCCAGNWTHDHDESHSTAPNSQPAPTYKQLALISIANYNQLDEIEVQLFYEWSVAIY